MTRSARDAATGDLFASSGQAWPEPDVPYTPAPDRRIWIGTSGWSFPDWVGPFYPPGTPSGRFLEHYARHFDCVEVNATYYGVPRPQVFAGMAGIDERYSYTARRSRSVIA